MQARLRYLLGLLDEARMLTAAREPTAAGYFQRKFSDGAADFLREHGPDLLAIAEAAEDLRADAMRYAWMRDNCMPWDSIMETPHARIRVCVDNEGGWMNPGSRPGIGVPSLDLAIDAALSTVAPVREGT